MTEDALRSILLLLLLLLFFVVFKKLFQEKNATTFLGRSRVSLDEISGILIFHYVPRIFDSARS